MYQCENLDPKCTNEATHHVVIKNARNGITADNRFFCEDHAHTAATGIMGYHAFMYALTDNEGMKLP